MLDFEIILKMKKVSVNDKNLFRKYELSMSPSLLVFDLPFLVEKMKHKQNYTKGELDAIVLLKTPDKQILLTALHEGTVIDSFQSDDSITFQILEGKLTFHIRKESVILEMGQLLTLHENVKYRLTTKEETVLLLTIASGALQLSVN